MPNVLPEDPYHYVYRREVPKDRKSLDGTPVDTSTSAHTIVSSEKSTRKASALVPPQLPLSRDNNVREKDAAIAPRQPPPHQHHVPSFAIQPLCPPCHALSPMKIARITTVGRPNLGSQPTSYVFPVSNVNPVEDSLRDRQLQFITDSQPGLTVSTHTAANCVTDIRRSAQRPRISNPFRHDI